MFVLPGSKVRWWQPLQRKSWGVCQHLAGLQWHLLPPRAPSTRRWRWNQRSGCLVCFKQIVGWQNFPDTGFGISKYLLCRVVSIAVTVEDTIFGYLHLFTCWIYCNSSMPSSHHMLQELPSFIWMIYVESLPEPRDCRLEKMHKWHGDKSPHFFYFEFLYVHINTISFEGGIWEHLWTTQLNPEQRPGGKGCRLQCVVTCARGDAINFCGWWWWDRYLAAEFGDTNVLIGIHLYFYESNLIGAWQNYSLSMLCFKVAIIQFIWWGDQVQPRCCS